MDERKSISMYTVTGRKHQLVALLLVVGVPSLATAQTDLVSSVTSISVNGGQVTYTVQVCNQSSTKSPNSQVALYYHLAAAPDCTTTANQSWMVMSLNPSDCKTYTHTQSNAVAGDYTAWSRADYNCQVSESNESNNNGSKTYSVLAELQVQAVTASVTSTTVTYGITVRNMGATLTSPFTLALFYDLLAAPACSATPSQTWTINGLSSNATVTQQYVRANVPAGSYEAWALVDSGCVVVEANETNNVASKTYEVGPDITLSPPIASVSGSTVTYSVQVCNHGTVATGAFSVRLWYDAVAAPGCSTTGADHTWSVANLAAWSGDPLVSCTTLTHVRSGAPAGSYQAWFFGDATCAVAESDETNNIRDTYYAISPGSPDLFVSSFSAAASGSTVTFTALVCRAPRSMRIASC
jgi:subtilase family serine protease